MTARRFEDLPICQRVGDIIRCHRAEFSDRDGQVFFKMNMAFSSSWSLFSADKEVAPEVEEQEEDWNYTPYAFSSRTYTFENNDRKLLDNIRPWNKTYFSQNEVLVDVMYTQLKEAKEEDGDFNVLGKITQVVHRDNWMSDIRITDKSGVTYFTTLSRRKFPRAQEGEIIKIRSAVVDEDSNRTNILKLFPHSNVMTIVPFSKVRKSLRNGIKGNLVTSDKKLLKSKVLLEPVLASTVSSKYRTEDISALSDLFDPSVKQATTVRARFYVVKATTGADAIQGNGKRSKSKSTCFQQLFLVRDTSTMFESKVYKVYLSGSQG